MEQKSHPLEGKHIIIAGAGLAGLAFARGLGQSWPSECGPKPTISVYERDPRVLPAERGNYSLGLRSDEASLGMQALQQLEMFNDVFDARTPGSELSILIRDANWRPVMRKKLPQLPPDGLPASTMRITRNALRECFVRGVGEDAEMHWEVSCTSASRTKDGRMEVALSDGTYEKCDLLVVADGASSKLRSHLRPNDGLDFAGVVMIGGNATFEPGKVPKALQDGVGLCLGGDGHGLVVFHITERTFVWFLTRRSSTPRTPVKGNEAVKLKDEIVQEALTEGRAFAEPFPSLIANTVPTSLKTLNAQDKRPISHSETKGLGNVVFIGDANHAVSPFAGNGANMALRDGLSLAKALYESPSIPSAIEAFDKESIPRCKSTLKRSHNFIRVIHSTGWGPDSVIRGCVLHHSSKLEYVFRLSSAIMLGARDQCPRFDIRTAVQSLPSLGYSPDVV